MVDKVKCRTSCFSKAIYYKPREIPFCDLEIINLSIEELEAIRLCDLFQVEQNEAADLMGVSGETLRNDLQRARQKIVDSIVNGKAIEISEGEYVNRSECKVEFFCRKCGYERKIWHNQKHPAKCPECGSGIILRINCNGEIKD
ncbi:MAG: DUF134 domain-containing protein [Methanosarcina sp.]